MCAKTIESMLLEPCRVSWLNRLSVFETTTGLTEIEEDAIRVLMDA
jgi:hypothetical protein